MTPIHEDEESMCEIFVPKVDRVNWAYVAKLAKFAHTKYGPFDGSLESDLRRLRAFRFLRGWLPALAPDQLDKLLMSPRQEDWLEVAS